MAALVTQVVSRSGLSATFGQCTTTGGDTFVPGPDVFLHFKNTGATKTITITPATAGGPLGTTISPITLTVAQTTGDKEWGPYPSNPYAGSDGLVALTYTPDATSLTVAVKKYPS